MFVLRLLLKVPISEVLARDLEAMDKDEDVNRENKLCQDGCLASEQFTKQEIQRANHDG